jgi:gas vesicle protein
MTQNKIVFGLLLGAVVGAGAMLLLNRRKGDLTAVLEEETDWSGRETYNISELSDEVKMKLEKLKEAYS